MKKNEIKGLACLASRRWWNAAGTRAIKTLAQAAIGALMVESIWHVNWQELLGIVLVPAIASLLMSLAGLPEVEKENGKKG